MIHKNKRSDHSAESEGKNTFDLHGFADSGIPCFNNNFKITPEIFALWMRLLGGVSASVLWLLEDNLDAAHNLRREAQAHGIEASRLVFAPRLSRAEHLARHRLADLFLDTQPYGAHTTASDALWAGCPVLTWLGDTFAGRVGASLLTAIGLPELIAPDVAGYVERAIAFAGDGEWRARSRLHLAGAGRESPLFDTATTTRALEAAYVQMIDQHRRGVRESFRVETGTI